MLIRAGKAVSIAVTKDELLVKHPFTDAVQVFDRATLVSRREFTPALSESKATKYGCHRFFHSGSTHLTSR